MWQVTHYQISQERKPSMELLNVAKARSIWLFEFADLNPGGKKISGELLEWLKSYYKFSKAPASPNDLDAKKALAFLDGSFTPATKYPISVELRIYSDGFVADTQASTESSDDFLNDVLVNAASKFELGYRPEKNSQENIPQRFIKSGCKKAQKQIFNGWIGIEG
jgi:hypothetical protein